MIDGKSVEEYIQGAFSNLVTATKRANQLDIKDLKFYSTLNPDFGESLENTISKTKNLINGLYSNNKSSYIRSSNKKRSIDSILKSSSTTSSKENQNNIIENLDDILLLVKNSSSDSTPNKNTFTCVEGQGYKDISEVTDNILERIDINLDGLTTNKKSVLDQSEPIVTIYKKKSDESSTTNEDNQYKVIHAKQIPRPQLKFKDEIDNSNSTNFTWKIKEKPHAKVPLNYGLPGNEIKNVNISKHLEELGLSRSGSNTPTNRSNTGSPVLNFENFENSPNDMAPLPHPYEFEIKTYEPPSRIFKTREVRNPMEWGSDDNFTYVDTPQKLDQMISEIKKLTGNDGDIAIDLEHHNYRSFMGFTCLIQLSTRFKDYIIDAIEIRSEIYKLNKITADPDRVKVFHGADSDIEWLQRDFGVYVVGLFDTYHASKRLGMQKRSLLYLLETIAKVSSDKKYQLADWRIRPLTKEMLNYARSDTHYLLMIFDTLINELAKHKNGINDVIKNSQRTSLKVFVKDYYDAAYGKGSNGWSNLLAKYNSFLSKRQLEVFKAVHAWRDQAARMHDESVRYVLPNHMLFVIANKLPDSVSKLISICTPTPPLVRLYANDIISIIQDSILHIQSDEENDISINNPNTNSESVNSHQIIDYSSTKNNSIINSIYPCGRFSENLIFDRKDINILVKIWSKSYSNLLVDQEGLEEPEETLNDETNKMESFSNNKSCLFNDDLETTIIQNNKIKELVEDISKVSGQFYGIGTSVGKFVSGPTNTGDDGEQTQQSLNESTFKLEDSEPIKEKVQPSTEEISTKAEDISKVESETIVISQIVEQNKNAKNKGKKRKQPHDSSLKKETQPVVPIANNDVGMKQEGNRFDGDGKPFDPYNNVAIEAPSFPRDNKRGRGGGQSKRGARKPNGNRSMTFKNKN
ncbi:hypothetical protein BB558_002987 [Smittium angustum]|uniref:HRDC domain-containing protein n=1 Tax=Smittium angustum TaxID=133377 RepID=A0A2U1J780_SMIAN|nr:hypothetical protein BB558_002987 [Smittium angustum]